MAKEKTKNKKSLKRQALQLIFVSVLLLQFITVLVCSRFFLKSTVRNHKIFYEKLAAYVQSELDMEYVEKIFRETKEIYEKIPEENRKDPFADDYKEYFIPLLDDDFFTARKVLTNCREATEIINISLTFYDKENVRLVLVVDGDKSGYAYLPGQYISNDNGVVESWDEIQKTINSDSYMPLSHTSLLGYSATDYEPLYGPDGTMIGFTTLDISLNVLSDDLFLFLTMFVPTILALFLILSFILSRSIDKRIISPIHLLVKAARSYTERDKVSEEESSVFFETVDIHTSDELAELRDTMADMEQNINRSMKEIRLVSAEKERIAAELDIAAQIQQSALPTDFSVSEKVDLCASMTPAKEVAGDFYDFFMIDEDHLAMIIADVSGKGVPAALFMMKGKELLRIRAEKGGKPSEILGYVNNALAKGNDNAMFITIWLGILEISTGIITASNAGHEYPFIADENQVFNIYKDPHGAFCGAFEGLEYEDYEIKISKGGGIFLYTDGVAEAKRADDKMFETDRIERCLNAHKGSSSQELLNAITEDINNFTSGEEQYDDITMLCLLLR